MKQYSLIDAIAEIAYQLNIHHYDISGIEALSPEQRTFMIKIDGVWRDVSLPSLEQRHFKRITT